MSKVFRLQNNVPEVYVEESRDFQLFCRLYDAVFGGEHYLIDSLRYASTTGECNERLLELLQTKLGYFTTTQLTAHELRLILQAFPHIIQYKGSTKAIEYVISLFRRLTYTGASSIVEYTIKSDHTIEITFDRAIPADSFLHELLNYVLPSGYMIEYKVLVDQYPSSTIYSTNKFNSFIRTSSMSDVSKPRVDAEYTITKIRNGEKIEKVEKFDNIAEIDATVGLSQVFNVEETKS